MRLSALERYKVILFSSHSQRTDLIGLFGHHQRQKNPTLRASAGRFANLRARA